MIVFPLVAVLVSSVFAVQLFIQFFQRRKPYQLAWAIALVFYTLGAGAEAAQAVIGWSVPLVKTYYLFGAVLLVGFLGLGTMYLMWSRWSTLYLLILLLLSVYATVTVLSAPVDSSTLASEGWKAISRPGLLKAVVAIINSVGAGIMIFGALSSGYKFWKQKQMKERAIANAAIGGGALIAASGGLIGGLLGIGSQVVLSATMAIGVVVMYYGFSQASKAPAPAKNPAVPPQQPSAPASS